MMFSHALYLLALQGLLGAFDTLVFHEWQARLVLGGARTRPELVLHATRSWIYSVLLLTLPRLAWHGWWAWFLGLLLAVEIIVTMADFVVEDHTREPQGIHPAERVTHGLMAIVYGAYLWNLLPTLFAWTQLPTALVPVSDIVPQPLVRMLTLLGLGVALSAARDATAAFGSSSPFAHWPWSDGPRQPAVKATMDSARRFH